MTTAVHVSISGNKQVRVDTRAGATRMQPGAHHTFHVHGDEAIAIREIGEFVSAPGLPLVRPFQEEAGDIPAA